MIYMRLSCLKRVLRMERSKSLVENISQKRNSPWQASANFLLETIGQDR